jgi:hypothetical protein
MALSCHSLGEDVSNLKISRNMRKRNNTIVHGFTNRMTVHFNMLSSLMVNRINSNLNGTSIICMKSSIRSRKTKLSEKPTKPDNLRTSNRHGPIFRFSIRFRNMSLFLTFPRDQGITKKHAPTCDRPPSIRTFGLICITISNKAERRACRKEQPTTR